MVKIDKNHSQNGFALPSVLIASIIMLTVLLASVVSTAAVRVSLTTQYYNQLSKTAADAGMAYAKACLAANAGKPLWTTLKPLTASTDCSGNLLSGYSCPTESRCFVAVSSDGLFKSNFSVPLPALDASGNATVVTSNGLINMIRKSDGVTWQTYTLPATSIQPAGTTYVLNLIAGTGGTVSGAGTFSSGASTTMTAAPNANYAFSSWTGDTGCSGVASHSITMTANKTCTANFVVTYVLTLVAGTGGTVSGAGTYNTGSTPTITASPSTNYAFSSWTGDTGCSGVASHTITMSANKSCIASFVATGYTWNKYFAIGIPPYVNPVTVSYNAPNFTPVLNDYTVDCSVSDLSFLGGTMGYTTSGNSYPMYMAVSGCGSSIVFGTYGCATYDQTSDCYLGIGGPQVAQFNLSGGLTNIPTTIVRDSTAGGGYTQGSYINQVSDANGSAYPLNGVQAGFWYVRL